MLFKNPWDDSSGPPRDQNTSGNGGKTVALQSLGGLLSGYQGESGVNAMGWDH